MKDAERNCRMQQLLCNCDQLMKEMQMEQAMQAEKVHTLC
jgi:hypothetical protein